ncbi:MAG: hypothetical protein H6507_10920 [Calditrichaeota bacterium]|nr:hypothetical protein [Calditrichota bacterium]
MATKNFAIRLDNSSKQTGDFTLKLLVDAGTNATFKLTFVEAGTTNSLDFISSKNGVTKSHPYSASVTGTSAAVELSKTDLSAIYDDADGGDWDYVQAQWTVGKVDDNGTSNNYVLQGNHVYDGSGWPPIL